MDKKRLVLARKAQSGSESLKWIIMIILAILLGIALLMMIMRWIKVAPQ